MEALLAEQRKAAGSVNLQKSLDDVQKTIDLLQEARGAIAHAPDRAGLTLAKLQGPVKSSLEAVKQDLKEAEHGLRNHAKTVEKHFESKQLPAAKFDAFSESPALVNRAIGMHLMREGQFTVAATFIKESESEDERRNALLKNPEQRNSWAQDMGDLRSETLRSQFKDMYDILEEMRTKRNLESATSWARMHSAQLEARGSNLEFELARLKFVWLFENDPVGQQNNDPWQRQRAALQYAREAFGAFQGRYLREVEQLMGAMAFCGNLQGSPYRRFFNNDGAWEELAMSFTREFCSLLGLSADSPVYIATTAGAIALPRLQKLQSIMETRRANWTTQSELPVEIPLPPAYRFHSIFVCPVSKEQTTDVNPPMMMPCGHVIAKDSLRRLGKVSKFKCPYCPSESHPDDATQIYL